MKKKLATIACTLLASQVVMVGTYVHAEETTTTVSSTNASENTKERLQINAVAIGNALTAKQKEWTLDKLGIQGETPIYETNGADLMHYLPNDGFTKDWAVYSSVRMQTLEEGGGIDVTITTPENITKITEAQYQNAALTAGIHDAKLTVASAVPIDGSGALAGVYKIVEESGGLIQQNRVEVAQEEMDVLSKITEENKDKDGYSDEALNAAQEQAKAELAQKQADGTELTQADIQATIQNALAEHGLKELVTSDQLSELTGLLNDMKEKNIFEDFVNELDLTEAKQQIEEKSKGLWASIKQFFSGIWESLTGNK